MKELYFATTNKGKIASAQKHLEPLGYEVVSIKLDLIEPQCDTVQEVAKSKVKQAFEVLGKPVFCLDGSFCIPSMGGIPGPYTEFFTRKLGAEGIIKLLDTFDPQKREAFFSNAIAYHNETEVHSFVGDYMGHVAQSVAPAGEVDWSPLYRIFIPRGSMYKTISLLSSEEEESIENTVWRDSSYWKKFSDFLQKER